MAGQTTTAQDIRDRVSQHMTIVEGKAKTIASNIQKKQQPAFDRATYVARQYWEKYIDFAHASPAVSAFLTIQVLLAAVPVLLFLGFAAGTIVSILVGATLLIASIVFLAGCVLGSVLLFSFSFGVIIFANVAATYLALRWLASVRANGLNAGTRQFVRNVETEAHVRALKTEDKLSDITSSTKLENVVPGVNAAA